MIVEVWWTGTPCRPRLSLSNPGPAASSAHTHAGTHARALLRRAASPPYTSWMLERGRVTARKTREKKRETSTSTRRPPPTPTPTLSLFRSNSPFFHETRARVGNKHAHTHIAPPSPHTYTHTHGTCGAHPISLSSREKKLLSSKSRAGARVSRFPSSTRHTHTHTKTPSRPRRSRTPSPPHTHSPSGKV